MRLDVNVIIHHVKKNIVIVLNMVYVVHQNANVKIVWIKKFKIMKLKKMKFKFLFKKLEMN